MTYFTEKFVLFCMTSFIAEVREVYLATGKGICHKTLDLYNGNTGEWVATISAYSKESLGRGRKFITTADVEDLELERGLTTARAIVKDLAERIANPEEAKKLDEVAEEAGLVAGDELPPFKFTPIEMPEFGKVKELPADAPKLPITSMPIVPVPVQDESNFVTTNDELVDVLAADPTEPSLTVEKYIEVVGLLEESIKHYRKTYKADQDVMDKLAHKRNAVKSLSAAAQILYLRDFESPYIMKGMNATTSTYVPAVANNLINLIPDPATQEDVQDLVEAVEACKAEPKALPPAPALAAQVEGKPSRLGRFGRAGLMVAGVANVVMFATNVIAALY